MNTEFLKCIGCEKVYNLNYDQVVCGCINRMDDNINHIIEKFVKNGKKLPGLSDIYFRRKLTDNPYLIFKEFFFSYYLTQHLNIDYEQIVEKIGAGLKEIGEVSFKETPVEFETNLAGSNSNLYIKDETNNVTGSHKARHLMGNLLYIEILYKAGILKRKPKLAVYSCGNAALGAAAVAKAGGYYLDVFIPPNINPKIISTLQKYDARIVVCPRIEGETGDPCYNRFQEALNTGSLPFSCSGLDNWSNLEGGQTLCLEFITQLLDKDVKLDSLVIQIGGGALASSAVKTLEELYEFKFIDKIPRIYTVQTEGAFPLARAYYILMKEIARKNKLKCSADFSYYSSKDVSVDNNGILSYLKSNQNEILDIAEFIKQNYYSDSIQEILAKAILNMDQYMWSWENEPQSIAHGILDDITYDWFKIIEGMFKTGGISVVVSEKCLQNANEIILEKTEIRADHTGTSGFAGYLELLNLGYIHKQKNTGLFFTGAIR